MLTRRTRRVRESRIWTATAAALVVHGTILGSVNALGFSLVGEGLGPRSSRSAAMADADADAALRESCGSNVMLAMSGRTAMCFAPWVGDVDHCLDVAQMNLWMELSSCQARNDPS